ncbi:hypothetical protein HPB51_002975 [Rhipicephalus microplus]|uniref:Uncharacterized protein n=1 Tax=Rhipicephalus microplus TaxID=6941 RepID=A0A9J6EKE5_RHIMP|nr:hypothetical protein HPB51_002975 [Rhipicephalus microplus]
MASVLLMSVRTGVLSVPDPTSPEIGAVKNATRRCHLSRPLLLRMVKPAGRREDVSADENWFPGRHRSPRSPQPPCPAPAPWRGSSGASTAMHNYGRISSQEVYSKAAFAHPTQTKTVVASTQTRSPGMFIVGRPHQTRISGGTKEPVQQRTYAHEHAFGSATAGSRAPYIAVMDVQSPEIPPSISSSTGIASRKRGNPSSESEDTELYSASNYESLEDGFKPVLYRAKRRLMNAS